MHIVEGKFHPNPAITIEMENARERTDMTNSHDVQVHVCNTWTHI